MILAASGNRRSVSLFEIDEEEVKNESVHVKFSKVATISDLERDMCTISMSSDCRLLAGCDRYKDIIVWDISSKSQDQMLWSQSFVEMTEYYGFSAAAQIAFNNCDNMSDNNHLAAGILSTLIVFDGETGTRLHSYGFPENAAEDGISALCYTPANSQRLVCSLFRSIHVFDCQLHPLVTIADAHSESINHICFDSAGALMATASSDGSLGVWSTGAVQDIIGTGALEIKNKFRLFGHNAQVTSCSFNNDSTQLVSCCVMRGIKVWSIGAGALVRDIKPRILCREIYHSYLRNNVLYVCGDFGMVLVLDTDENQEIGRYEVEDDYLNALCIGRPLMVLM
jgi:WD40 repeat protein